MFCMYVFLSDSSTESRFQMEVGTVAFSLGNIFLAILLILLVKMTRRHIPKVSLKIQTNNEDKQNVPNHRCTGMNSVNGKSLSFSPKLFRGCQILKHFSQMNKGSCPINMFFSDYVPNCRWVEVKSPKLNLNLNYCSHLETPANGQAVVFLTGLLEVFISEISFWQQYRTTLSVIKPYKKYHALPP